MSSYIDVSSPWCSKEEQEGCIKSEVWLFPSEDEEYKKEGIIKF